MEKVISYWNNKIDDNRPGLDYGHNKLNRKQTYLSYNLQELSMHLNKDKNKAQDVHMTENNASEEMKIDRHCGILDIKQLTNKLSPAEILNLINEELDIDNISEINPFRLENDLDKQSINQWSDIQHIDEIRKTFISWKPREKLTSKQLAFVASQIEKSTMSISEMSKQFRISKSMLYKIKAMTASDLTRRELQQSGKVFWIEKQMIIQCIQKFIRNRTSPFIVKDVRSYVYQNIGRYYQYSVLHKIMKKDLKLSYKRCKPRLNSINFEEVVMKRRLFSVKFAKMLQKGALLANIDETTIGRDSQIPYSWSPKGIPSEFKNQPFVGSVSIVLTILSNGAWYWLLLNQAMNSEIFSEYISRFNSWIKENNMFGFKNLIIMLDNWSSHRSKNNLKLLETLGHQVAFLPAYSPQFAPIEMWFNYIKQILKRRMKYEVWNLSNSQSHNKIWEIMRLLEGKIVANYFRVLCRELKRCLTFSSL